jgi:hypothetical protein
MTTPLRTTDDNGNSHCYELHEEISDGRWSYRAEASPNEFYEAVFIRMEGTASSIRPDMLANHQDAGVSGTGITEALFRKVVADSGCTLVSSKPTDGESFSCAARRAWQRLEGKGAAFFDAAQGRYVFKP